MSGQVKNPRRAWINNPRLLFAKRIDMLKTGDALICDVTRWQINCVNSADNLMPVYIIMRDGKRVLRRKDKGSVLRYILSKHIPPSLQYIENGALASLATEEDSLVIEEEDLMPDVR